MKLFALIRPRQWVKNFFCFAPIIFSAHLFDTSYLYKNIIAFFAFCFVSSAVYIINDIADRESDRVHKKKRFRPIASGEVSVKQAMFIFGFVIIITGILTYFTNLYFFYTIVIYFLINLIYSVKAKHIVLLDIFFISAGFILRVIGGAVAISVSLSSWMILTAIFISLFLAISKRRAELSQTEQNNIDKQRKVLTDYGINFTDQMNTVAATGTIICYALYTVSEKTVSTFNTENLIYTTPFVIFGIFRYLYLIHQKNLGESPTQIVLKDIPIILTTLSWFFVSVIIIYKDKIFS